MLSSSQDVFLKLSETTSSPKLFPSDCIRLYVQNSNVDYASFYMLFDLGLAVVQRANQNNVVREQVKKLYFFLKLKNICDLKRVEDAKKKLYNNYNSRKGQIKKIRNVCFLLFFALKL